MLVSLLGVLLLVTTALLTFIYISFRRAPSADLGAGGPNALWATHDWVGDPHTASEYAGLASLLRTNDINDVFFHVGPLDASGEISNARYRYAADLLHALKRLDPSVVTQAWIGQIQSEAGGPLDLSRPAVLDSVVRTAASFLALGFDGIHYDIEPVFAGDQNYLRLLDATHRLTQAKGAVLSVAAPNLNPLGPLGEAVKAVFRYDTWTQSYFLEVASRVDQIAVMSYGGAFPTAWLYGAFMKWETHTLVELLGGRVTVFMGIPTYDPRGWGFVNDVESVPEAISGIDKGLPGVSPSRLGDVGVALYADWTTDAAEWASYRRDWLQPQAG